MRSSLVDITYADGDGPPAMTCGICHADWAMGHDCPSGASEQGGLVVPSHIAQDILAATHKSERDRKKRRWHAWAKLVLWFALQSLAAAALLRGGDLSIILLLIVHGVSSAGWFVSFLRLKGRLLTHGHVPSSKHVVQWGNWQGRGGKGVE